MFKSKTLRVSRGVARMEKREKCAYENFIKKCVDILEKLDVEEK
jgi:hypothetical protein